MQKMRAFVTAAAAAARRPAAAAAAAAASTREVGSLARGRWMLQAGCRVPNVAGVRGPALAAAASGAGPSGFAASAKGARTFTTSPATAAKNPNIRDGPNDKKGGKKEKDKHKGGGGGGGGGRGLHSSTLQLNVSALYGIGAARRGCTARLRGMFWGVQGVFL